jgi:hypothetical protein
MSEQKISYMQQADAWLDQLLHSLEPSVDISDAKRAIKDKLLESYRNGQQAGPSIARPRVGAPRPPFRRTNVR